MFTLGRGGTRININGTKEEFMEFSNIPIPELDGVYLRVIFKVLISVSKINTYD